MKVGTKLDVGKKLESLRIVGTKLEVLILLEVGMKLKVGTKWEVVMKSWNLKFFNSLIKTFN